MELLVVNSKGEFGNYWGEGRLAIWWVLGHGHAEELSEQGCVVFQGKVEDKGYKVSETKNNKKKKNMTKMANFSFLTIAHTFFLSLDTY